VKDSPHLITLQHFTERFRPRLIAMAASDTEIAVRVAVIQVLRTIDEIGMLSEEAERSRLCLLIFDEEVKVRRAVSGYVRDVWRERVTERLVGHDDVDDDEPEKKLAGAKALAMLLVEWEKALAKLNGGGRVIDTDESQSQSDSQHQPTERGEAAPTIESLAILSAAQKGRIALAVEALWDEVDAVSDWQTLLDILLLDHSGSGAISNGKSGTSSNFGKKNGRNKVQPTPKKKGKGSPSKAVEEDDAVDEAWRLDEAEESTLIDVLLSSLQKALADENSKKGVSARFPSLV
jgi:cohesin complex subunit SA-1/2